MGKKLAEPHGLNPRLYNEFIPYVTILLPVASDPAVETIVFR